MIGDVGYLHKSFGLKEFSKDWYFERKYITAGKNKVRLNRFEDLKSEDENW
jgi:hypothetical protein